MHDLPGPRAAGGGQGLEVGDVLLEGGRRQRLAAPTSYSPGPVAFHRLLAEWREGDMSDVLVLSGDGATARPERAGAGLAARRG